MMMVVNKIPLMVVEKWIQRLRSKKLKKGPWDQKGDPKTWMKMSHQLFLMHHQLASCSP